MSEEEPRTTMHSVSPTERITMFAGQMADYRNLDRLASEALVKFAVVNYRIQDIKSDFRGTTLTRKKYYLFYDESQKIKGLQLTKENYSQYLLIFTNIAFSLYNSYLNNDANTRVAAKEVQNRINDIFLRQP